MRVINHVKTVKTDNKSKYRHFHCKSKQPSVKKQSLQMPRNI